MLEGFETPKWVRLDEDSTDRYGKFYIEPLERGYGVTIGNALRRVLLSSLEGAAITAVRLDGIQHEFTTVPGIVEDLTEIVLNLKRINLRMETRDPIAVDFEAEGDIVLTAGDLLDVEGVDVLNPEQHIMTLNNTASVALEVELGWGRGYRAAVDNKRPKQPLGTIPIDSIFSPVTKANFQVEDARVGQTTDYDRLIMEVWTNGSMLPEEAITTAARILIEHFEIFVASEEEDVAPVELPEGLDPALEELLQRNVSDLELSVRSANCLLGAQIRTLGDLVSKTEGDMLRYRNFGRKSLDEIKSLLEGMGLGFGMFPGSDAGAPAPAPGALPDIPSLDIPDVPDAPEPETSDPPVDASGGGAGDGGSAEDNGPGTPPNAVAV